MRWIFPHMNVESIRSVCFVCFYLKISYAHRFLFTENSKSQWYNRSKQQQHQRKNTRYSHKTTDTNNTPRVRELFIEENENCLHCLSHVSHIITHCRISGDSRWHLTFSTISMQTIYYRVSLHIGPHFILGTFHWLLNGKGCIEHSTNTSTHTYSCQASKENSIKSQRLSIGLQLHRKHPKLQIE